MAIPPIGDLTQAAAPTKTTTIDRGVTALFRAMIANAKGDRLMVAAARGELVVLAGETEDFETQLTSAVVDRLAPAFSNASRAQTPSGRRSSIVRCTRKNGREWIGFPARSYQDAFRKQALEAIHQFCVEEEV